MQQLKLHLHQMVRQAYNPMQTVKGRIATLTDQEMLVKNPSLSIVYHLKIEQLTAVFI
ncbi:MAG: hypothetical protein ACJAXY_000990 [Nonlabens sp.]|uniref:hypothetical protein n=1 Tax=Nonlabens sp. TaxID=1888209 RepID=UPI0039E6D370